jgi:hypothetical protein
VMACAVLVEALLFVSRLIPNIVFLWPLFFSYIFYVTIFWHYVSEFYPEAPATSLLSGSFSVPSLLCLHEQPISHLSHVKTPVVLLSIVELFASSNLSQILCKLSEVVHPPVSFLFRPPEAVTVHITIHVFDMRLFSDFFGQK